MKKQMLAMALALSAVFAVPAQAAESRVEGSMLEASYGVGVRLGEGKLNHEGQEMKFKVRGLSLLSVGLAGGNFNGVVKNLKSASDFEGSYTFAEAGAAYGLGANVQRWVNDKGVVIEITGVEVGVELRLGPGALGIHFVK